MRKEGVVYLVGELCDGGQTGVLVEHRLAELARRTLGWIDRWRRIE